MIAIVGIAVEIFPRGAQQLLGDIVVLRVDLPSVTRETTGIQHITLILITIRAQHEVVHIVLLDFHEKRERAMAEPHLRAFAETGHVVLAVDPHPADIAFVTDRRGHPPGRRPVVELEVGMEVGHRVTLVHTILQRSLHQFFIFLVLPLLLNVDGGGKLVEESHFVMVKRLMVNGLEG